MSLSIQKGQKKERRLSLLSQNSRIRTSVCTPVPENPFTLPTPQNGVPQHARAYEQGSGSPETGSNQFPGRTEARVVRVQAQCGSSVVGERAQVGLAGAHPVPRLQGRRSLRLDAGGQRASLLGPALQVLLIDVGGGVESLVRRSSGVGLEVQREGLQVEVQLRVLEVDLALVSLGDSLLAYLISILSLHLRSRGEHNFIRRRAQGSPPSLCEGWSSQLRTIELPIYLVEKVI